MAKMALCGTMLAKLPASCHRFSRPQLQRATPEQQVQCMLVQCALVVANSAHASLTTPHGHTMHDMATNLELVSGLGCLLEQQKPLCQPQQHRHTVLIDICHV
eukprot:GHRR01018251.1.p4 GENE.GHRR01018251.1~~GHRR01018251.1.p4  ORF type:complete len:103 (+),score=19.16 GHRR01018251.1:1707-2015(+)